MDKIKAAQVQDEEFRKLVTSLEPIQKGHDGVIRFNYRLCILFNEEPKNEVQKKAHHSKYTIHSGVIKMYQHLKGIYWRSSMKNDVVEIMAKCLFCQQVKFVHQRAGR